MKQTLFLLVLTFIGVAGSLVIEPFVGVLVYFFFAVLRPQFLWQWALPSDVAWSQYVAWATIFATGLALAGQPARRRFSFAHKALIGFGCWICLTYVTSQNRDVAWVWFLEYLKIFLMFAVGALAINSITQVWRLYLAATVALIYIAYEMNFVYLTAGRLDIYHNGYGGLDNNGAALMLAMGIPLALFAWEAISGRWRWLFLAGVPVLLHAVLMSYSRGAMLSLILAAPILLLRSRRKAQLSLAFVAILAIVPLLAGPQIRTRFLTIQKYEADDSANSRLESWGAAFQIANDYPVFGVGIRNSNLLSHAYGADIEGRTIHSQYLQTLADSGYTGLGLYLLALGSLFVSGRRTRRFLDAQTGTEALLARSVLNGAEGALVVFCIGATFLSLEVFELPYLAILIAAQVSLLTRLRSVAESRAVAPTPPLTAWQGSGATVFARSGSSNR